MNALLTLCETLSRGGIGPEALPACQIAQQALQDAAKRYESTRKMGTTGIGLQAFRELYEWHDLQRASIHRSKYEEFIRLGLAHTRNRAAHVVEI